eukprot:2246419-Pleurochrysis_carterae.AAC.3
MQQLSKGDGMRSCLWLPANIETGHRESKGAFLPEMLPRQASFAGAGVAVVARFRMPCSSEEEG